MKTQVGLKLTKFHCLLQIGYFIREYGFPLNFFEGHLEEFLKHSVKKLYSRTTRQHTRHLYDLTSSLKEIKCLDLLEEDLKLQNNNTAINIEADHNTRIKINSNTIKYVNNENNIYLNESKFLLIKSEDSSIWNTHKNHYQSSCCNECIEKGLNHPWNNNSYYNELIVKLTTEIDSDGEHNENLNTRKIVVCSKCIVRIIKSTQQYSTWYNTKSHPNYRAVS